MSDTRRALPSVSALLESAALRPLVDASPRTQVVEAVRAAILQVREGAAAAPSDLDGWAAAVAENLAVRARPSLRPVINATGVVLHTNLGRAPLAAAAIEAVVAIADGYSTLEYDASTGARGSRYTHCAALLRELTGAEDAIVVNNCAAALVLALDTVAHGREAILSRGELVEIGGSFRIHEIMEKSGARLREVGATNRTHLADYVRAIGPETGALLKVHRSNFAVTGFVADVGVPALVPHAREHGLPIIHDLGSGLLVSLDEIGLRGEPTAREALADGASLVLMSGDKLLGGPQAGIVVGDATIIAAMRDNPLARSYRVDKMTLAALEATLSLYRDPPRALREIPVLAMLGAPVDALRARANSLVLELRAAGVECEVIESVATVGAGAFPAAELPSVALALSGDAGRWSAALRGGTMPVAGRTIDGRHQLDLRTVEPRLVAVLREAVVAAHS